MKKIINGKMYNTDTAKLIDSYEIGSASDFGHLYEALYQKKTGEFFVYGEGGAMTEYAKYDESGNVTGGSDIRPITDDAAKEWLERHSSADVYISVFGTVNE